MSGADVSRELRDLLALIDRTSELQKAGDASTAEETLQSARALLWRTLEMPFARVPRRIMRDPFSPDLRVLDGGKRRLRRIA